MNISTHTLVQRLPSLGSVFPFYFILFFLTRNSRAPFALHKVFHRFHALKKKMKKRKRERDRSYVLKKKKRKNSHLRKFSIASRALLV
jgi:hypothetical protein